MKLIKEYNTTKIDGKVIRKSTLFELNKKEWGKLVHMINKDGGAEIRYNDYSILINLREDVLPRNYSNTKDKGTDKES